MKSLLLLGMIVPILGGCAVLSAMGIGVRDLAPSLNHCDRVQYDRKGLDVKIVAHCKVPVN